MGLGLCRPGHGAFDKEQDLGAPGHSHDRAAASSARAQAFAVPPSEVPRRIEQLGLELRQLRDDNFQIREEQLRLQAELRESARRRQQRKGGGRPSPASGREAPAAAAAGADVDKEQQLAYMQQLARALRAENASREQALLGGGPDAYDQGAEDVPMEEYLRLRARLASLQQAHLSQLRASRQLQASRGGTSALTSAAASTCATPVSAAGRTCFAFPSGAAEASFARGGGTSVASSAAVSGVVTPVSVLSAHVRPGRGDDIESLQEMLQALTAEQESLRNKVRKLAHKA